MMPRLLFACSPPAWCPMSRLMLGYHINKSDA